MKEIENTSEIQRRCLLDPENRGCEECEVDTCPYIYCQKHSCLDCTLRMLCPMCEGECTKCEYRVACMIYRERELE